MIAEATIRAHILTASNCLVDKELIAFSAKSAEKFCDRLVNVCPYSSGLAPGPSHFRLRCTCLSQNHIIAGSIELGKYFFKFF